MDRNKNTLIRLLKAEKGIEMKVGRDDWKWENQDG